MSEHTKGPFAHRFDQLATFENGRTPVFLLESEYNRARAAWNACEGISTENLEHNLPVLELAKRYNAAIRQRDDLLAALKDAKAALEWSVEQGGGPQCEHESGGAVCFCRENTAINTARAAIAKAEAGRGEG